MATINELVTAFGFELKGDALKKVNDVQDGINQIGNATEKLGKLFTGGKGLAEYFKDFIGSSNELKNLSVATGYSTEAIQKWQYAARAMGVDANSVINSLGQLKNQYAIGEKGILQWADTFKKSGRWYAHQVGSEMGMTEDLINMLLQGSETVKKFLDEAENVGAVLTQSEIEESAELYRDLDKSLLALSKTTDTVMAKIVPSIQKIADKFNEWLGDDPDAKIKMVEVSLAALVTGEIISGIASLATNLARIAKGITAVGIASAGASGGVAAFAAGFGTIALAAAALASGGNMIWTGIKNLITGEDEQNWLEKLMSSWIDPFMESMGLERGFLLNNNQGQTNNTTNTTTNNMTNSNNGGNVSYVTNNYNGDYGRPKDYKDMGLPTNPWTAG